MVAPMPVPDDPDPANAGSDPKQHFVMVENRLLERLAQEVGPGGIVVYLALVKHANWTTMKAWPSHETLCHWTGIRSRDTIIKHLDALEAGGFVEIEKHRGGTDSFYLVPVEKIDTIREIGVSRKSTGGVEKIDNRCRESRQQVSRKSTRTRSINDTHRKRSITTHSVCEKFDEFFNRFPDKTDEAGARQVWAKINPDAETADAIIASIDAYQASGKWDEVRYVGHAANFLAREKWKSPPTPRAPKADGSQFKFKEPTKQRIPTTDAEYLEALRLERERNAKAAS
ncbi:MAG: helix-turn-helix domain-containing protein [Verrucomicrobiota bacterium]